MDRSLQYMHGITISDLTVNKIITGPEGLFEELAQENEIFSSFGISLMK